MYAVFGCAERNGRQFLLDIVYLVGETGSSGGGGGSGGGVPT